ncbi:MAG TPA: glyoxalase [Gammaproteobacteria bacterium]|nr:glyoxalase [Gammaproteobacteria bacterium]HIK68441.1 glyoxalase [Pseudomonadales bacterium]
MKLSPFHVAIAVRNLQESRQFYGDILGCAEGRSSDDWVDFNFFGHQLVIHHDPGIGEQNSLELYTNPVDRKAVPVPHLGVVLEMPDWEVLAERLKGAGIEFMIEPYIRFRGLPGEQATLFFLDPTGNALEFKSFKDIDQQLFQV